MTTTYSKVRIMVESALLIAIGVVLMNVKIYELPNGGSVTALCMLPFILISFRHGTKWGLLAGFVNCLFQMITRFWPPITGTLAAYIGVILLDYVLAFTLLGLAALIAKPLWEKHRLAGIITGTAAVCFIRFICSFLSGFLIWGSLTEEGMGAVIFSLGYNASYMVPETILTVLGAVLLYSVAPRIFNIE